MDQTGNLHQNVSNSPPVIREIRSAEDRRRCVDIQSRVWGTGDSYLVDEKMLEEARAGGGILLGAYRGGTEMVGFVLSFHVESTGQSIQHSHILAVLDGYRDQGLGSALKQAQYEEALRRGNDLITWTFDPLEARNAHLNFNKLGVVSRTYFVNFYAESSSPLHQGIDTDRLLVEWPVLDEWKRPRRDAEQSLPPEDRRTILAHMDNRRLPVPESVNLKRTSSPVFVEIPVDFQTLKKADLRLAQEWRTQTRAAFQHYLASGFEVDGFVSVRGEDPKKSRAFYRLQRTQAPPWLKDYSDVLRLPVFSRFPTDRRSFSEWAALVIDRDFSRR